jgi:lysophospholipase L1-like esterase
MANFGADYRDLVQRIYTARPSVRVVVTWIPYSAAPWAGNEVYVNIDIYTWVVAYFPQAIWVNLAQYPTRLMFDGVHPSDYGPIARLIYTALATQYSLPPGPADAYALTTANCRPGIERAPTAITC